MLLGVVVRNIRSAPLDDWRQARRHWRRFERTRSPTARKTPPGLRGVPACRWCERGSSEQDARGPLRYLVVWAESNRRTDRGHAPRSLRHFALGDGTWGEWRLDTWKPPHAPLSELAKAGTMAAPIAPAIAPQSRRPLGGIGIRSGFKIRDPKRCPGSSPGGATSITLFLAVT